MQERTRSAAAGGPVERALEQPAVERAGRLAGHGVVVDSEPEDLVERAGDDADDDDGRHGDGRKRDGERLQADRPEREPTRGAERS